MVGKELCTTPNMFSIYDAMVTIINGVKRFLLANNQKVSED